MDDQKKIRVACNKCNARYVVDEEHGGRMGRCSQCSERFILPIPCPERLLEWAESTSWRRLTRFVDLSGARGHCQDTMGRFIEVFNQRRWDQEHAHHRSSTDIRQERSFRQTAWQKTDLKMERDSILGELISFTPLQFEELVADIFSSLGMTARAVGGSADNGIDVKIWGSDGQLFGIAQCKRYAKTNKIGASQIREFAGSYMMSKASKGFFFTTSSYTRNAKKTARGFPWLTIYNGYTFTKYIQDIKFTSEILRATSQVQKSG